MVRLPGSYFGLILESVRSTSWTQELEVRIVHGRDTTLPMNPSTGVFRVLWTRVLRVSLIPHVLGHDYNKRTVCDKRYELHIIVYISSIVKLLRPR